MAWSNDEMRSGELVCGLLEKRGNSSLYAGTRIRDDRSETVGSGTEKISSLDD